MSHPYKSAAHKNDPKWVKNLNPYVEKAKKADVDRLIDNYGGDKKATNQAANIPRPKGLD